MNFRTLIVDDEAHARSRIQHLLQAHPDFRVIGECGNGTQAVERIQLDQPDVVFLDVKMPGMDGFEVCRSILPHATPLVVFVTAFDQFALKAFEVRAIDYLLKPFDEDRFKQALAHIRDRLSTHNTAHSQNAQLVRLLEDLQQAKSLPDRFAFKVDGRVVLFRADDISWIESDGNYLRVHCADVTHHLRETLASMESQLPPDRFIRISRSTIVNLDRILELQALFYGDYTVILKDGTKLGLSRNYRDRIEALLKR